MSYLSQYILLTILTYGVVFLYSRYEIKLRNNFRKYYKGKISKIIKSVGYKIIGIIYIIFLGFTIYLFNISDEKQKILISIIFITSLILLNYYRFTLFTLFGSILELILSLVKPLFYRKKNYEQKVKSLFRISLLNIGLLLILLLSFSFNVFLDNHNYQIVGFILVLLLIYYLINSLVKIFVVQKDLIMVSNHIEIISNFLDSLKSKKGAINMVFLVTSIFTSMLSKDQNSKLLSSIEWAKEKLKKFNFISKLGLSIFKTYLTVRLVFVLVFTIVLVIFIFGNYLMTLDKIGIIGSGIKAYPDYLLNTFYIFTGDSSQSFIFNINVEYFKYGLLIIGVIGWLIPVAYIILFIDIMSISLNEFSNSINELIKKTITELNELFDKIIAGKEKSNIPKEKIVVIQEHLKDLNKKEKIANYERVIEDLEKLKNE